jgi:GT2 family glycosyltransferase
LIDVTISLVSHNQRQDLERLLRTLLPSASLTRSEILLVDNQSIDRTKEFVQSNFPNVDVVLNSARAGYGENHNLNLKRARGRFFVIMNSDITVEVNLLIRLCDFMDQHPDIGIVSPKILNADGTIQGLNKRYPTLLDLFLRRFVPKIIQRLFQKRLDYYEMKDVGYEHICDVPFLSGAFMFCRTELLKSLGGFDPKFFLYFEDVDLCRRVQQSHRTVYFPTVSATHFWERSAHKKWVFTSYFIRSAFRYFRKWGYKIL